MPQYSSGRQKNLNLGISSYTENDIVLDAIGNVRITGIITASEFYGSFNGTIDNSNYSLIAGVSTSVIGGIGSISFLSVSGISTFLDGPVLIGSGNSTGTPLQPLQITGGGYFSDSVGIGTSLPTQKLDVLGGLKISGQIFDRFNNPGGQNAVLTADPINSSWYWASAPAAQIGVLTATGNDTYFPTLIKSGLSSVSSLQIDNVNSSGLAFKVSPARLGIGTTNPTTSLHVVGNSLFNGWGYFNSGVGIGTTSIVEIRNYNINNGTFSLNNNGGNQMFSVSNIPDNTHEFKINQYLGIGTATRSVFTIDNNGAVSSLFPVNIAVGQSNNYRSEFNNVIWGEVNIRAPYSSIGSTNLVKIVPKYLDRGALSFESPVGTALTDRGTQIFSISNNLSSTIFRINDLNRVPIFEATSSGNIGIGTTLPSRKFQVTGTTRISSIGSTTNEQIDITHFRNTSYPLPGSQPITNRGGLSFDSPAGISTDGVSIYPSTLFALTNDPTGNLFTIYGYRYFSGTPWPVVDITQNGRLGIGITNPRQDVHINYTTAITANVGIGTTNPSVGLDVNNTSQFRTRISFSQTGNPSDDNVFDLNPVTVGISSWAPSGGALVMTQNRNNTTKIGNQVYTIENNSDALFKINCVGFGVTRGASVESKIYNVLDINSDGDVRIFDTETRKILSSAPGFSSTIPGDGDFLRIDTYTTPFIGSFPTVSKAIRLDKFGLIELNRNVRQISGNTVIGSSTSTGTSNQNLQVFGGAYVSGDVGIGTTVPRTKLDIVGGLNVTGISTVGLGTTSSPTVNSSFSFELTNNTTLTVRVRGTDGVVRTGIISLS